MPPVTALRSPPDSRMTGADSPVIADSSTEATPSTTSPSPGIRSPASQTTMSPGRRCAAGTRSSAPSSPRRRAVISLRVARSAFAWALPRPSATASAKFAKTTVSQSQRATTPGEPEVVGAAPEQVGEEDPGRDRAAHLDHEHHRVADLHPRVELAEGRPDRRDDDVLGEELAAGAGGDRSWARGRTGELVQVEVEQEDVDAGLAEEPDRAALGVVVDQVEDALDRARRGPRRRAPPAGGRWPPRCGGRCPSAEVVIMSTGRSCARRPGV